MRRLGWFSDDRQDQKLQPFPFPRDFAFVQRTVAKSLHVESVPVKEVTDLVSVSPAARPMPAI